MKIITSSVLFIILFFSLFIECLFSETYNKYKNKTENNEIGTQDTLNIFNDVFDIPELNISSSPDTKQSISFPDNEKIIDFDVSPSEPNVAVLLKENNSKCKIKFWNISKNKIQDSCTIPERYAANSIAWLPRATALFVLCSKNKLYNILRIEKTTKGWITKNIFSSPNQLRRLVVCPRPFIVNYDYSNRNSYYSYRLFFGMDNGDKSYRIVSITETGEKLYQVIGPEKTESKFVDAEPPSEMKADYALPIAFHPSGNDLIWEDRNHSFYVAEYDRQYWGKYHRLKKSQISGGTITPTPNGLGLLHWQKDKPGIGLFLLSSEQEVAQLQDYQFISTPSSVPDGKGIVGLTNTDGKSTLNYLPIKVPLADISNAWMYCESDKDMNSFQRNFGIFREIGNNQLYELYDSENYNCGGNDRNTPTRPYLVTTDIFWELFGAAFEGLFIVKERDDAIPNFWTFINKANQYYQTNNKNSKWAPVVKSIVELNSDDSLNPEVQRMLKAEVTYSELLKKEFNYTELKPRFHYTSDIEMQKYFIAFKYFTTVFDENKDKQIIEELNFLPTDIKKYALNWIKCYMGFISPPRSPLVWKDLNYSRPVYSKHPFDASRIFPLSWGFDNEVLYSTVYHPGLLPDEQIDGRMLPSGLDIATALGNHFAENLLNNEFEKYPNLKKVLNNLKANFQINGKVNNTIDNLYDRWMTALAVQWADSVASPNDNLDKNIWNVKRLQTGLASWATLHHATGLVNERTAAECGEGGFEEILLSAPRGYVEPDPYTFGVIADLFETATKYVSDSLSNNTDFSKYNKPENASLYVGIIKRLNETAQDARLFKSIAEKEKKGQAITNDEYLEILHVGGIAEHNFLIFKSLDNKDYALSTPDPISKIADVAGKLGIIYLMSAVGNPIEWDHVVPFYGRHQIVKGAVYSYYEFSSEKLLDDNDWREMLKSQSYLPWLKPYISNQQRSYPPKTGY
jgi:hypothetical protein